MLLELHAVIYGQVQGVCFRATTRRHAQELEISGTVQNLPDGSVEIYAQGTKVLLERLLVLLKKEYPQGITSMQTAFSIPNRTFSAFQII